MRLAGPLRIGSIPVLTDLGCTGMGPSPDRVIQSNFLTLTSGKADNCSQVTKMLQNVTNQSLSSETVHLRLRRLVGKQWGRRKGQCLASVIGERMDFAVNHKEWTLDDWKRVVWSDETKVNCLGSDGRKWAWKWVDGCQGKGLFQCGRGQ